jgi:murein L,D-transpeptidase YcbB/YkuD
MQIKFSFSLVFAIFLFSCGNKEKVATKKDLTKEERASIEKEELEALLNFDSNQDSVKLFDFHITTASQVKALYNQNKQELFWFSDGKPKSHTNAFIKFLATSKYFGLDSNFYYYNEIKKGIDSIPKSNNFYAVAKSEALNDLLLTNAWLLMAVHLNKGFIDAESMRVVWKIDSLENKNLAEILLNSADTSITRKLLAFEPTNIEYRQLKAGLKNYLDSNNLDTLSFRLQDPKKDSTACWNELAKALLHWKYIDSITVPRDTLIYITKKFQTNNGLDADAIIGNFSRKGFATSNANRFYYAAVALEKWRWKPKRDGKIQFHVNIPAYQLHVIRNDSLIRRHRVVTGAPDHQSPEFKAKIRYVTLVPYWHVPHSIATKEIAVFLRRDTTYLKKHGYQLLNSKNEPADLTNVRWKALGENYFPFKVRQNGGYGNSLGIVAFHFPNKYDVYLHDTPAKNFFRKNMRAFSHGCIRLQNPIQMAEFILKQDHKWKKNEFNMDTLMAWIGKKYEQRIILKKSIPIEIDYITVTADSLGKITFHPDVYLREAELIQLANPKTKFKPKKKAAKKEEEIKVTVFLEEKYRSFYRSKLIS